MQQISSRAVPSESEPYRPPAGIDLTGAGRDANKYLSVSVQGEVYGLQVLLVREIIEYAEETALPMMPDFVRGAINLRGSGVPVVDLARRLGGQASTVGRRSCIVVVEAPVAGGQSFDVGFLVDSVNEVVDIAPADVEPTPSFGGKLRTEFLRGMGKVKGRFVKLLQVDRIIDPDEIAAVAAEQGTAHELAPKRPAP